MQIRAGGEVQFAATDVADATGCGHRTTLKLRIAEKKLSIFRFDDPALALLQQRGLEHEAAYVAALTALGLRVERVYADGMANQTAHDATIAAMRAGIDVIVQARLLLGDQGGTLDILRRVETPSALGAWSYEVYDTKLARSAQLGAVMQVAYYSAMVAIVQGSTPAKMHLVAPALVEIVDGAVRGATDPFATTSFATADFAAYFRRAFAELRSTVAELQTGPLLPTYPEPCAACASCSFAQHCEAQREADDHLSLVPGATTAHRAVLAERGIDTVAAL
ncbi:MAG TPA: hypothetical protein PLF40_30740, partial [Kofleriaceae bacterium]|nr:hypothetical protein [Kofleriaceae bacterium]